MLTFSIKSLKRLSFFDLNQNWFQDKKKANFSSSKQILKNIMMKLRKHESLSSKSPRLSETQSRLRQTSLNKHYENENDDCVIIQVSATSSSKKSIQCLFLG